MNRLILTYGTAVTVLILAVFAWVVYRRIVDGGVGSVLVLVVTAVVVWVLGTVAFILLWPRITVGGFKRVFVRRGLGGGPIPVNTLYAVPESSSDSASAGSVISTGTDDVLYVGGWLDVTQAPQVLHVPEMGDRYHALQFTDPATGANVAYVGRRTTGSRAGDFLLCSPGWHGSVPAGMTRIVVPHRTALIIGRVFVADEVDRREAYALATQLRLTPLGAAAL